MEVLLARHEYIRWLAATRDLSPHTIRAYNGDIAALEHYIGPSALVDLIDQECLVRFVESQRSAGLSARSVKRRAAAIRGFCRWLVAQGRLELDPWVGVTVPSARSRALPRLVAESDLKLLLRQLCSVACVSGTALPLRPLPKPHDSTTLLGAAVMVATGVRVNELVSIKCDDLDLPGGRVRVLGKGRRERHVILTTRWLVSLVDAYLAARASLGVRHDRLFFNRRGDALSAPAMRSRLSNAAREANISARITPHMLRHSAATRLLEAGVDIRIIQRLLGHASVITTEIYTHVSDQTLQRALNDVDVLGGLLRTR